MSRRPKFSSSSFGDLGATWRLVAGASSRSVDTIISKLSKSVAFTTQRTMLIDDLYRSDFVSALGTRWWAVTDTVMGGVSQATLRYDFVDGRRCLRLTGAVRLENNGGFIQMTLDLAGTGEVLDASAFRGIQLLARGNGEGYAAHLRTPDNARPWQSYRSQFRALSSWHEIQLPFSAFAPHRINVPMDASKLKRLGLVAIGRAFDADLAVAEVILYT